MMSKSRSPLARGLRALWLLPLVCLGLGLQAQTIYVPTDKDSENFIPDEKKKSLLEEIVVVTYAADSVTSDQIRHAEDQEKNPVAEPGNPDVDTPPVFSEDNFSMWLNRRIAYPKGCLYEGNVVVGFTVNEKGNVEDVHMLRSLCEELDNLIVNLVKQSPAWTPAIRNGNPVPYHMAIPVTFMIRLSKTAGVPAQPEAVVLTIKADGKIESGGKVYTVDQLKDIIPPHETGQSLTTVQIVAADNVPMGAINDVKDELRRLGSLKINYASPAGQGGTTRHMPPFPTSPKGKRGPAYPEELFPGEKRENICMVRINSNDKFLFGNKPSQDDEEMLRLGKAFVKERGRNAHFALQTDRGTSYGAYRHIQELLVRIYMDLRDEKAQEQYGKPLAELTTEEKNQINWLVPIGISETEPKRQ